jgi:hypothetical protein
MVVALRVVEVDWFLTFWWTVLELFDICHFKIKTEISK